MDPFWIPGALSAEEEAERKRKEAERLRTRGARSQVIWGG